MDTIINSYGISEALQVLGMEAINPGASTGSQWLETHGEMHASHSPADGTEIGQIRLANRADYEQVMQAASEAFLNWRTVPAPARGEVVRQIGNRLREYKEPLARLVSYEMGKIYAEGLGEVQEMIDICDFATGLSRQLYGLTMHSERPQHRMYEQYHPLGVVGVISAFNFPVAVWAWNAMLAMVCGDSVVWKPSSKVMLCAIAVQRIIAPILKINSVPEGVLSLVAGSSSEIGHSFLADTRMPLISATGSVKLGRQVAREVGERLGKTLLELGGNNGIIITPEANTDLALRAVLFGAAGTCGQRCTSTRRLIIHESVYESFKNRLVNAYKTIRIGHPLDPKTLVGPLIDKSAVRDFETAIEKVKTEGGTILCGGEVLRGEEYGSGCYVSPCIAEVDSHFEIIKEETFAPLLYLVKYNDLDEAIRIHNNVPQGLSSAIFTNNMVEMEKFLSPAGSDCGIANVNIGTSGAEIGGAFGGEKETGGGRESGSDSWKIYMRRQTNTINYGTDLPLAQGIHFDV
jgi:aldehyde dehydrogenase (NAD+)